jgi:tight adherence protein B
VTLVVAGLLASGGLAAVVAGLVGRTRQHDVDLAEILGLLDGDRGIDLEAAPHGTVASGTLGLADRAVHALDRRGTLRDRLERADLSVRPAELVVLASAGALVVGVGLGLLVGSAWAVLVVAALAPLAVHLGLDLRAGRRASRFAAQLPDALGLVASSLSAGHTFLRSIQMMADELDAPLADEFRRVVNETQLGQPLVASLEAMAARLQLRDVDWMVQAIRIQQQVGGQLSELLATLADFMRAREEVRREIRVLTAEGRISAYVLGALPVLLFVAVQLTNPGYLAPMLRGWGLLWLALTALSMGVGMAIILRMVRGVEL